MADLPRSPLAPARFPKLPPIAGCRIATGRAAIHYRGRADLLLMAFDRGTTVAGALTRSKMPGAPVDWCRQVLPGGTARALVVNAGNANVFTGQAGEEAVRATVGAAARLVSCQAKAVLASSTGVIGVPLPHERITKVLPAMHKRLKEDGWRTAAAAIMTTDTFAKGAGADFTLDGKSYRLNGIAKGSGMIAPDMATMLSYLVTDARLPAAVLKALLKRAVEQSYNCTTVDADTSTSDTVLLFATGKGKRHQPVTKAGDPRLKDFKRALNQVTRDLAQQVVRDGEGAQKFITITVTGAENAGAAKRIALTVANSPLVKTAIAGEDANWGRVVMAVGRAGEKADRDRMRIRIGGVLIADNGHIHPDYREADVVPHMQGREIDITVDVAVGRGRATVWTCDLTHGYIEINADYRS